MNAEKDSIERMAAASGRIRQFCLEKVVVGAFDP